MLIRMCVLSLTYLTYQNTCNVINNIIEWVFSIFYLMSLGYMFQERNVDASEHSSPIWEFYSVWDLAGFNRCKLLGDCFRHDTSYGYI